MKSKKLYKDMDKYKEYKRRYQRKYRKEANAGVYPRRPYSFKEDMMILNHEMSDRELAEKLQRSIGAIQGRRNRLKKEGGKENE